MLSIPCPSFYRKQNPSKTGQYYLKEKCLQWIVKEAGIFEKEVPQTRVKHGTFI